MNKVEILSNMSTEEKEYIISSLDKYKNKIDEARKGKVKSAALFAGSLLGLGGLACLLPKAVNSGQVLLEVSGMLFCLVASMNSSVSFFNYKDNQMVTKENKINYIDNLRKNGIKVRDYSTKRYVLK